MVGSGLDAILLSHHWQKGTCGINFDEDDHIRLVFREVSNKRSRSRGVGGDLDKASERDAACRVSFVSIFISSFVHAHPFFNFSHDTCLFFFLLTLA